MKSEYAILGQYNRLRIAIREDLCRWQCEHMRKPDAIFLTGEARHILGRDLLLCEPCDTSPVYPVSGPIQPPARKRFETLYGLPVYEYYGEGIEYYFAKKRSFVI